MKKSAILLGDIHGSFLDPEIFLNELNLRTRGAVEADTDYVIQVGDFGWYSRGSTQEEWASLWKPYLRSKYVTEFTGCKKIFIPGNHEEWPLIDESDRTKLIDTPFGQWKCAPRGYFENGIFFVGGAFSVDRIPGFFQAANDPGPKYSRPHGNEHPFGWWEQEELGDEGEAEVLELFEKWKHDIRVVVTHDCPTDILHMVFRHFGYKRRVTKRTNNFLQELFDRLPKKEGIQWIFGHHHADRRFDHLGTKFTLLEDIGRTTSGIGWSTSIEWEI